MKRDLSELGVEKSKEFLDYFNASLRAKNDIPFAPSGSGRFTKQGHEAYLTDWIATSDGGKIQISWKILQTKDGSLIFIEAIPGVDIEPEKWESIAQDFLGEILVSVLSSKKKTFFKRRHFAAICGSNLDGEYWLPGFRFAPQLPDDESKLINAERLLVIDQNIEGIDSSHADELADERAALAAAHLSLITDVGLYKPVHECKWILLHDDDGIRQERLSTQHVDLSIPSEMPKKQRICQLGKFENSVFMHEKYITYEFVCPIETRKILRGLRNANPALKAAFHKCSLLYQLALTVGRYHPTVRIAYECASVNAITQELGGEFSGFSDFVRKNIQENVDGLLDLIHGSIRSAHWHGGEFALGETDHRRDFLTNPEGHIRFHVMRDGHRVIRTSIFNWVMNYIADENT